MENKHQPQAWGTFWDIFGRELVDLLEIHDGAKILDAGTGGGSVLYPAVEKVGSTGQVIGIDTSETWVERTNAEIKRCNISNASAILMDGRHLTFEDHSFDFVTSGFIGWDDWFDFEINEFKEQDLMMEEFYRVLKLGGKMGKSTWLIQEDLDLMRQLLTSQSIQCRKNYSVEPEEGWRIIMANTAFKDIQYIIMPVSYTYPSEDAWWDEMMDYNWIVDKDEDEIFTGFIKEQALSLVQDRLTDDGGVTFKRVALIVLGTK